MRPRHNRTTLTILSTVAAILLGAAPYAAAQQTIVSSSRSIDWRGAGIPGGIPNRTTSAPR